MAKLTNNPTPYIKPKEIITAIEDIKPVYVSESEEDKAFKLCKDKFAELNAALLNLIDAKAKCNKPIITVQRLREIVDINNRRLLTK